jgi:hypothetical protein
MGHQDPLIKHYITRIEKTQNSLVKNGLIKNLKTFLEVYKSDISDDVKIRAQELIKIYYDESSYEDDFSHDESKDPNCQKGKSCVMQGGRKKRRSLNKRSKSRQSKGGGARKTKKRSKKTRTIKS